jgi:hypothetical protein
MKMTNRKIPMRYLPKQLSKKDRKRQIRLLNRSKKMYKRGEYFTRKRLPSFHNKPSLHIRNAMLIYGVDNVVPSSKLARATGCSVSALAKIVNKGEGAYYSSGSRPNQTAQSWGYARLASAITSGKSAAVDYNILSDGCKHNGRAFKMAEKAKRKYGNGHGSSRKYKI